MTSARVRMGLHTGHPEPFEDNLVGLDVHLAARVSATAHGGQVVLSSATAERVADLLRPARRSSTLGCTASRTSPNRSGSASWSCPGCRRLPPLRSLGTPGSLPAARSPLVGREDELVGPHRVLTPGGDAPRDPDRPRRRRQDPAVARGGGGARPGLRRPVNVDMAP